MTTKITVLELQAALDTLDDGILKTGKHKPGREFCALEFESQVRKREWSDKPITLPDLRPLNDAGWSSDKTRTEALLPVMVALWNWAEWSTTKQMEWVNIVRIETVKQIIGDLSTLPDNIKNKCRVVKTAAGAVEAAVEAARAVEVVGAAWAARAARAAEAAWAAGAAARAAGAAGAVDAVWASSEAAGAAEAAAWAAARAAGAAAEAADKVLLKACNIWITAADQVK